MPALTVSKIVKSYDGNPAVREISFTVAEGKVLALCGENGAGKSTLMKMLSGAVLPDSGTISLDGREVHIANPADAMGLGIQTVYQELSLLPHLSVAENMLMGRMPCRRLSWVIDWPAANRIASEVLAEFGFADIDPAMLVSDLSVARQQIVEIAKALVAEPHILILDEPTAVLSALETEKLFDKVRKLAAAGTTILYISHRMEEIFRIAEEFVVLKDGRSVLSGRLDGVGQGNLIEAMVGRPLEAIFPERNRTAGAVVVEVEHLTRPGVFRDIDFKVRAGEIVGMFGLVGSGRTEVAKAIFGAEPAGHGTVKFSGRDANYTSPRQAVRDGIAMITEDRKGDGLALDASVMDNASLASFGRMSRFGVIDGDARKHLVDGQVSGLSIRPKGTDRPVRQLSGGNQQKVVLAKWLLVEGVKLFIFDEPTRGVDIATKVEIYRMIAELATEGAAVLLISSEMPEVIGLSDRLLVMREGTIVAELTPDEFSMEVLFMHAAGLEATTRPEQLH
ncbi:sugar ABC transporter ATP-binding protein [Shinella sp.]|uniref:sugar ABC transporter ATP-binding protein n=1 Tax=Shinella sp. TaxID=1870904 RepID=UPI003F6EBFCF